MNADKSFQPSPPGLNLRVRYIMVGGFLGAGKTTALIRLAEYLAARGQRVGLIANDQGHNLVDTALLRARGFPTEEIPGGCFCCRFNSLLEAAGKLAAQDHPDVFLAEPVGSCTDLVATVTYPLRRMYGDQFTLAPLSVLVDPMRAQRLLGLSTGGAFSEKVRYIYRKQLEEADLILINKRDLLDEAALLRLRDRLAEQFPHAEILPVSARLGEGLEPWFATITTAEATLRPVMAVDYDTYAEGEALLGWLNCTVRLESGEAFDGNRFLRTLARSIQVRLRAVSAEIAHLKMTLSPEEPGWSDLAVVNVVRNDIVPELGFELSSPIHQGRLILNCRAEAAPEILDATVRQALAAVAQQQSGLAWQLEHAEHFRPGRPQPTHRFTQAF